MRRALPYVLLALSLALVGATGCKKKRKSIDESMARMQGFADLMCRCKPGDKPCANEVHEAMNAWSAEIAGKALRSEQPTEAEMKQMMEFGRRYSECMVSASGSGDLLSPSGVPPQNPAGNQKITNADQIVKLTYDQLGAFRVAELSLSYVRSNGELHPTYGKAEIRMSRPAIPEPADDPNREIGAPVPAAPPPVDVSSTRCPKYVWSQGMRSNDESFCMSIGELSRPHCSVIEVWKQAIEAGAPPAGLAMLELALPLPDTGSQIWKFRIDDDPRNIHFAHDVPDTCEPTLEKPTPTLPAKPTARPSVKANPY